MESIQCVKIKMSQGPEAGILMGQRGNTWHLSIHGMYYCMPGEMCKALKQIISLDWENWGTESLSCFFKVTQLRSIELTQCLVVVMGSCTKSPGARSRGIGDQCSSCWDTLSRSCYWKYSTNLTLTTFSTYHSGLGNFENLDFFYRGENGQLLLFTSALFLALHAELWDDLRKSLL